MLYNKNFFGKYTRGSSYINVDKKNFFSKKNILTISKNIANNCKRMDIDKNDLRNKIIMNVGSGREALGLLIFNPEKIYHYDISNVNISQFKKIIKQKKLEKIIITKQFDLSKNNLPKNKFDLIYLHGIIQHVSRVDKAIVNLSKSLKNNGKMWFYFYRAGSLNIFLAYIQRYLLQKIKINQFIKFAQKKVNDFFLEQMLDDCYAPIQLFYPKEYYKILQKNKLKINGNSFLINLSEKYNFLKFHSSVVLFLKKVKKEKKFIFLSDLLKPKRSIDVLNRDIYQKDPIIQNIIFLTKNKKINLEKTIELVIKIEKIKRYISHQFLTKKKIRKKNFF